ncbi:MAG: glycosyltransferase [Lachnospiraceae bacterium]|nr:glycosyltransferase [Lachnospiraceae bacterium]
MLPDSVVDVVIPVYRPGRDDRLVRALTLLQRQTVPAGHIILMNTEERLYTDWAERERIAERFPGVTVRHVTAEQFDHAATRTEGAACSEAAFLLFMTMDAVPADEELIGSLLETMRTHADCAVAYARQLPAEGASEAERFTRSFNYPPQSSVKKRADEKRLGIKASFASNVCAMYRREIFEQLGGFAAPAIFNEDMVFAHAALHAGYAVCYCAEARVFHSHNYSAAAQFHRNFDLGVSQAMHPEVFAGVSSEKEGRRLVTGTVAHLRRHGAGRQIPAWLWGCVARYAGFLLGKHYRWLPRKLILQCTNQRSFWK